MLKRLTGEIYEIYYNGEEGAIKVEYIGKKDKDKTLEEIVKALPKITARYEQAIATIIANVSIEEPRKTYKSRTNISKQSIRKRDQNK